MGESRFFPSGAQFHAGHGPSGRPVYGYHEPVLTAPSRGHAPQSQQGWGQHPGYSSGPVYQPYIPLAPHDPVGHGAGVPPHYPHPSVPHAAASPQARSLQTGAVMHGLGAVLSVALIFGASGWMWQMMQRDVAGVPVVRALEGPSRVAPENPGGRQAAHQGLSVNELAGAQEEMPREQIVLAPPPLDLGAEDMVRTLPSESVQEITAELEDQPIPVSLHQDSSLPVNGAGLGMNEPTRRAVATSLRPPARDDGQMAGAAARVASLGPVATDAIQPVANDLAASVANSVAMGLSGVRDRDVDPATIGPGTRLVQLGAYDDAAAARAAWDALASRFSPLLDDRGRVIEAAHSGGSVFYRLRAHGFSDERDARRFCAALVDQQIDCIPVLIR